jgi:hypothetical protein
MTLIGMMYRVHISTVDGGAFEVFLSDQEDVARAVSRGMARLLGEEVSGGNGGE